MHIYMQQASLQGAKVINNLITFKLLCSTVASDCHCFHENLLQLLMPAAVSACFDRDMLLIYVQPTQQQLSNVACLMYTVRAKAQQWHQILSQDLCMPALFLQVLF